jgi:cytochrome c553
MANGSVHARITGVAEIEPNMVREAAVSREQRAGCRADRSIQCAPMQFQRIVLGLATLARCLAVLSVLSTLSWPAMVVPDTLAQRALACTACHRAEDHETPHGYVPRIAGKPASYLFEQMRSFRDGRRQHDGMARLLEHLDDGYLAELAGHVAALAPSHRATRVAACR